MWKQIRGNNPNLQYHYLVLYRIGKVTEFLSFFPMYKKIFYRFYTAYHNFITEVHEGYLSYYIKKESKQIDKRYFIHVSKIHHEIYLPSLATNEKKKITHRVVREYFDKFEPGEVLYYLNN
jgi:hypothetical protein